MSHPASSGSHVILKLYRDCLRLIQHVAPGASPKSMALKLTVRSEFKRNMQLRDEDAIEAAKANAVRALSNYLLATAAPKDAKLQTAAKDYHSRSVMEAKSNNDTPSSSTAAENEVKGDIKE